MRRGRVFLYLSLILILLIAGGYFVYNRFFKPAPTGPEAVPTQAAEPDRVDIVVITQNAPRGTVLDETLLGVLQIPRDLYIDSMFTDMAQVVGRQAKFDLDSGIPLTVNMLVDTAAQLSSAGSVASLSIPDGMVAKSIPINRLASVSYALRPGDRVVVIASMQFIDLDADYQTKLPNATALVYGSSVSLGADGGPPRLTSEVVTGGGPEGRAERSGELTDEKFYIIPSESQRPRLITQIIIPSATVLHVGDFEIEEAGVVDIEAPEIVAPPADGAEAAPPPEEPPPDNITLIVTPQEAVNLTYLINSGVDISLALRSAGDSTVIDTQTATIQYFLDNYAIPLPAKLPYGLAPRVDEVPVPGEGGNEPQPAP
jgi:Flp pilus assembly protein CpaB